MKIKPLLANLLCFKIKKNVFRIMRMSTFLLFVCVFKLVALDTEAQNMTINLSNNVMNMGQLFNEIEQQTDYLLVYSNSEVDLNKEVRLGRNSAKVLTLLQEALSSSGLNYEFENDYIIISKRAIAIDQQSRHKITGIVRDDSGEPIIGSSVSVKGTTIGTATDVDGNFTLQVPENATLVVSYIGFNSQEIIVGDKTNFNITLSEDTQMIDEVVVIGFGSRSKRDITTAISNVGAEVIGKSLSMSAENAMQGSMSGVQVSGNTGNPMARPTIRIRGTNTWGVSDPLYVIDGIAITEMGAGIEGKEDARLEDMRGPLNIMSMIDPSDIESISILKDASAAAIYGVRAANGVILITTKKGRKDKPTVDFSARYGVQNITQNLNYLTTQQYTKFVQDVYASDTDLSPNVDNAGRFDPNDPRYLGNSPTYDWQKAVRNKNAPTQDYSMKVSGGTDNTDYYISLGYSDTQGTLLTNSLKRYSGAMKINTKINEFVRTGINYRLVNAIGVRSEENFFGLTRSAPWQPIYSANGIPGYNGYAFGVGGPQPDGSYSTEKLYGNGTRVNQVAMANINDNEHASIRNMGNVYIELTPLKGLSIKGSVSLDMYTQERSQFEDNLTNPFNYTAGDPSTRGGGKSVGTYGEAIIKNFNLIQELSVNYANSFDNHNFDILFNFSNQQYNAKYTHMQTEYMTTTKDYLRNLGGENEYTSMGSDQRRWALQGYLFRVGYNYKYKYYLDATVRRDGSARFAPENRWGTFPSISAAWRITSEDFMSDISWLQDLKLRAGWGQLGNQEVRDMAYLSAITTAPTYAWGNYGTDNRPATGRFNTAATIFGIPNRELSWEKTEILNFGFDAQLFKGLSFSAEYYNKLTHGILQAIDLPASVGFIDIPVANVAKVENRGLEFSANYSGSKGDFFYNIGANLTTTRNRVKETYKHIPTSGGRVEEGHSMFYHKAYKVAGIFQTDAEAQEWMNKYSDDSYNKSKVGAGDFYFQDLRGAPKEEGEFYSEGPDGKIDSYDMVDIGKSIPGYFYGFNIGGGYKDFDFSLQFSGVGDVIKYNEIKAGTFRTTEGDNPTTIVYKAWTPSNMQNEYPRLKFGDPASNMRYSDFFFESGAYLRLQNIVLGYTLPKSFYKACNNNIRNVRIYVGSSNLLTITKYTGLDPESDSYPVPTMFYMGLTAKF